ncbi:MAG TPA: GNAT family N-acetyltransferase, partial [Rhodopila sp.]|nr:GNAT family N-acetyltransferase [Rhodopila sp.]
MTVPRFNPAGRFDPASLFRPASIAVIGADTETGAQFAGNLALSGFKGPVQLVRDPDGLESRPDLSVLAVPGDRIGDAMTRLAARGCFAAIVPGPADDLAAHASRTGVRVLGAHSFGLVVPALGLNASCAHIPPSAGRLALVGQSSALARAVIDWAAPNGVGFSHIVGVGANADIGYGIVLDWLSRDPGTGAILLDIRRIKNHRLFLSAARAAAKLRPVVAIRAGLRLLDADGAADLAFEAALRRAGVLSVRRLEDLLAAAETLSRAKPARCDRLAIVTNAIGPGRLAADSVLRDGLHLLPDETPEPGIIVTDGPRLAHTAFQQAGRTDIGG